MGSLFNHAFGFESEQDIPEWVAFDLDGTVAHYTEWKGIEHIGEPIPATIDLIKKHLEAGDIVKIFTARVSNEDEAENQKARDFIQEYTLKHVGQKLDVTCKKDKGMIKLYDDRAQQVIENTGIVVGKVEIDR